MPSAVAIRDRLPSLYRPEENDVSLLTLFLQAVGTTLDRMQREMGEIMQAHWFGFADRALYSPFFLRSWQLTKPDTPFPPATDPILKTFPYIYDLARLGALWPILPWEQPPELRELVEEYRQRMARIVAIYRGGLGTIPALRGIVAAQLPVNRGAPEERLDRPFWIEEGNSNIRLSAPAATRGAPDTIVGPLMRWSVINSSLRSSAPAIYIHGIQPKSDLLDATQDPVIELFENNGSPVRLGIAFSGKLAANQSLRLRPSYSSWLGTAGGLLRSESLPDDKHEGDPTAPGPWNAVAGGPTTQVTATYQTIDKRLWAGLQDGSLRVFDGTTWSTALTGLNRINVLRQNGSDLLIGTDTGLLRVPLFPEAGPLAAAPAGLNGHKVMEIYRALDGSVWLGADNGLFKLAAGTVTPGALQNVSVFCIAQDSTGDFYLGSDLGLLQWQTGSDHWFWYEGKDPGEETPHWRSFTPNAPPAAGQPFLPPVHCILRGRDASLWLGTENGIARYTAYGSDGLNFETVLEAFPDLTSGKVLAIKEDERGLVWFATDRGLFRYDGRDMWQFRGSVWVQMGRADTIYPGAKNRGDWRFQRASSKWQHFDSVWTEFSAAPRSTAETAIQTILWTDGVVADIASDGDGSPAPVAASQLKVRYKPTELRIVNGGIPAIPRLPAGNSKWRYLRMESAPVVPPADLPWWSTEGRLFPPPPQLAAPGEGRFDISTPPPPSDFDEAVFSYNPAASLRLEWRATQPLAIVVRLKKLSSSEQIDPAITKRVWEGIQQVRPAGVSVQLAVEEDFLSL